MAVVYGIPLRLLRELTLVLLGYVFVIRPGMIAMVAEKAASKGMSIENMTTSLRIGKDGTREFVIDAMVSSPNMADIDNLDSIMNDMSTLKAELGLTHFDVFVHAGKHKFK